MQFVESLAGPGQVIALFCCRLKKEGPQGRIRGPRGLTVVQGLGTDFAHMIDPHETGGMASLGFGQLGSARAQAKRRIALMLDACFLRRCGVLFRGGRLRRAWSLHRIGGLQTICGHGPGPASNRYRVVRGQGLADALEQQVGQGEAPGPGRRGCSRVDGRVRG